MFQVDVKDGVVEIHDSQCKVIATSLDGNKALTVAQLLVEYCYPIAAKHKQG